MWIAELVLAWLLLSLMTTTLFVGVARSGHREDALRRWTD